MIKLTSLVILTFIASNFGFAQVVEGLRLTAFDSTIHHKIYRVQISDFQVIELIESNEKRYSGELISSIWKTNRKEEKTKLITESLTIPDSDVKEIMAAAYLEDIEILNSCEQVEGCVTGLDGRAVSFSVEANNISREYSYWEPENDNYQNNQIKEIQNVRNILASINSRMNLSLHFDKFTSKLTYGTYSYGGIIMTVK